MYIIHTDFHTHTVYSHGKGTVEANVRAARRKGLKGIGISDHGPANLFGVGVARLTTFERIRADVRLAALKYPDIRVYFGVEANVVSTEGHLDIPPAMQNEFDYILAGLHPMVRPLSLVQMGGLLWQNLRGRWDDASRKRARVRNTDALIQAVYRNRIHVVTHPGYRLPIDTRELARACADTGTALEINTGHDHITVEYIRIAAHEGARFVIGSDAHSPDRVGDFTRGLALAREAGLTPEHIVNAMARSPVR